MPMLRNVTSCGHHVSREARVGSFLPAMQSSVMSRHAMLLFSSLASAVQVAALDAASSKISTSLGAPFEKW